MREIELGKLFGENAQQNIISLLAALLRKVNNCILWFLIKLDWVFMKIFVCPLKYHSEHYFGTCQKKKDFGSKLQSSHRSLYLTCSSSNSHHGNHALWGPAGLSDKYYRGENMAQKLETYDLVPFAKQIAAGMVFLGSRGVSERFAKYLSQ